ARPTGSIGSLLGRGGRVQGRSLRGLSFLPRWSPEDPGPALMREPLPIDEVVPEVVARLREGPALVLEAPAGAGKTPRVPPALLSLPGEVVVLEPRRLAARAAARRVAQEMGERPGETAGYQVRFEDATGPRTRLRYVTEGVLTRRLLGEPL